jgi:hypothetical protein
MKSGPDMLTVIIAVLTLLAEGSIAFVIWLEMESARLDRFFEYTLGRKRLESRGRIYKAFCALPERNSEKFYAFINEPDNSKLRDDCEEQLRLLQMVGGQLPWWPWFQRRVLNWFPHAIIFIWVILRTYVEKRREQIGWPKWADEVQTLAERAAGHLLKGMKGDLVLIDPARARDYRIRREELEKIAKGNHGFSTPASNTSRVSSSNETM